MLNRNEKINLTFNLNLEVNDVLYHEDLTGRSLYKVYNHDNALYYTLKIYDLEKNIVDEIEHEMTSLNKQLNLPGIFPKYHYIKHDKNSNTVMLLMDWIDGATLNKKFAKPAKDRFDIKIRLNFIKELCTIVDKIHNSHLSHRDLKPENIIVRSKTDPRNNISIIDFGLSASTPTEMEGTDGYRSPEQEFAIASVDKLSDIFSIGQITFWLITGQTFYAEHENYKRWYEPNFNVDIEDVENEKLIPYFRKILAFNQKERYQSVKEVRSAIEKISRVI